jgi:thiol-disulfide isomerase/thioredoxin
MLKKTTWGLVVAILAGATWALLGGQKADTEVLDVVSKPVGAISIPTVERPGGRMTLRPSLGEVLLAEHTPQKGEGLPIVLWLDLTHPEFPHAFNVVSIMEDRFGDRLKIAFRHLPQDQSCNALLPRTRNSQACSVAVAAQCTGDLFWSFLSLLAKNPGSWTELDLRKFAKVTGLEEEAFATCLRSDDVQLQLRKDIGDANDYGLANNSRILVNGVPLPLGINTTGLDAVLRHEMGENEEDAEGRIAARRLAPVSKKGETGTLSMRAVDGFFIDAVEASWAKDDSSRSVAGLVPVAASWEEASAACRKAGKRMCKQSEWRRACSGRGRTDLLVEGRRWPHSDRWQSTLCWDAGDATRSQGYESGQKPYCVSPEGVFDLTGNLWEWVGETKEEAVLVGGSFVEGEQATCSAALASFGTRYSAPWTGFRCCADTDVPPTGAGVVLNRKRTGFVVPEEFQGQKIVVHFVTNSCAACRRPTTALADLQAMLGGVPVLMIVVNTDQAVADALVDNSPVDAQALWDPQGQFAGQLAVLDLPTTLVLDEDSAEIARMEGYDALGWAGIRAVLVD